MWALIEQRKTLMHCENTTFVYDNDLNKYVKVEGVTSEEVFDYLFDVGVGKFLLKKGKRYLHELFQRWDREHVQLDDDFDNYLDNDRLEDIIGDEGMQNLNIND